MKSCLPPLLPQPTKDTSIRPRHQAIRCMNSQRCGQPVNPVPDPRCLLPVTAIERDMRAACDRRASGSSGATPLAKYRSTHRRIAAAPGTRRAPMKKANPEVGFLQ